MYTKYFVTTNDDVLIDSTEKGEMPRKFLFETTRTIPFRKMYLAPINLITGKSVSMFVFLLD